MGKVGFLMGPTSSGIAMGLTGFARENKKILVLTQAATDALTGAKFHPLRFQHIEQCHDALPFRGLFDGGQTLQKVHVRGSGLFIRAFFMENV